MSPYGPQIVSQWGPKLPSSRYHSIWITQTIALNKKLNEEAQAAIDAKEPKVNIWQDDTMETSMSRMSMSQNGSQGKGGYEIPVSQNSISGTGNLDRAKSSKLSGFRKSLGFKSGEERRVAKADKAVGKGKGLKDQILSEEASRWPDQQWRAIVQVYQEKTGMATKILDLRARQPTQYFHLLRAGYFEPIPIAWATQASNPLKFTIEPSDGWRGITPAWRGYEDTAEERLYWVLNHREGSTGTRLKPDFISALDLARQRASKAVPPPPEYFDSGDTCQMQDTKTDGYSKQVMPPPFRPYDRPENPTDDTMILLDVSGSMDFVPQRPRYERYLVTGFDQSGQPKNKGTFDTSLPDVI